MAYHTKLTANDVWNVWGIYMNTKKTHLAVGFGLFLGYAVKTGSMNSTVIITPWLSSPQSLSGTEMSASTSDSTSQTSLWGDVPGWPI